MIPFTPIGVIVLTFLQPYNLTETSISMPWGQGAQRGFIFKYYIILKYKSSRLLYQYYHPILTSTPQNSNLVPFCKVVRL